MSSSSYRALLQLLLALLLVVSQVKCAGFETGKKYVYHYESRVATGVSDQDAKQFAGRGFEGTITVTYDGEHLAFKASDLKVSSFNKKLDVDSLFDKVESQYKPIDAGNPKEKAFQDNYVKPFWADYKDGVIKAVYFEPNAAEAAVNGKKAIASLFQTDFHPLVHEGSHVYKLYEDGIGGDCNTLYHVAHHPEDDHPEEHVLNVTKVRFYDECKHRPHLLHSSVFGWKCPTCDLKEFKAVKNLGRTDYKIKGTKQTYTIEQIDSTGVITFSPFSTNGQTIISAVNQTLTLVEVSSGAAVPLPALTLKFENVHYKYHNDFRNYKLVDLDRAHYYDRYHEVRHHDDHHVKEAEEYISHIGSSQESFHNNAKYVAKLIKSFRHFSYSEFVSFFVAHVKPYAKPDTASAEEQDVRSLLYRILPFVGTNPAVKFMFELIKAHKMSVVASINAIAAFPFHVKEPNVQLLKYVEDFPENESPAVNEAKQLALGTLVFRSCVKQEFNSHPHDAQTYVDEATCTKVVEGMIEKFRAASGFDTNKLLRAIVNTRHEASYPLLVSVLNDDHAANNQRLLAIWGMWNFFETKAKDFPDLFAPIFYNPDEDYELRSYAFDSLLFAHPKPEFFSSVIHLLNEEKDDKLANYMYATLSAYANTSDPCMEPIKYGIRQALSFIAPRFRDVAMHGSNRIFSVFNPKYNYGRALHFISIADNASFVPRDLYFRQSLNLFGYNFEILEFGTAGKMGDYILGEVRGLLASGLNPHAERGNVETKATKQDVHPEEYRGYDFYYRHGGQFIFSEDVTHLMDYVGPYLEEIVTDEFELRALDAQFARAGGATVNIRSNKMKYVDVEYSVPNEMGLPVVITVKAPITYKLSGKLNAELNRETKLVTLRPDLQIGFGLYMKMGMSVNTAAFGKLGYGVKTDIVFTTPIRNELKWDRANHRLDFDYVPSQSNEIFHYHSVPQTFNDRHFLPVTYAEKPTERVYHVGHKYLGVGLTFNFTYDYKWNNYGSYRTFFKSFFKKASSYEEYFQLADKWFAGSRNFLNYALFNPTAKPFHLEVEFSRCRTVATNKFHAVVKRTVDDKPDANNNLKRQLEVQVKATGEGILRQWETAFAIQHSFPYGDQRVVQFRFKRNAIPEYDSNPLEFCYKSNRKIHDLTSIFAGKGKKNVKWEYDGELNIGRDCAPTKQVKVKGLGEKSEEQLSLVKEQLPIYKKCKQDTAKGYEYSYACWLVKKDLGRLDKFTFDVQYKNVPDYVRSYAFRLYGWLRHTFYNNLEIDHFEGNKDPNHVQITANFSYFDPILDVKVVREGQTVYYHDVFVPSVIPRFEPISVTEDAVDRYLRRIVKYHRPRCYLSGDYVDTLDHVVYKAKISSCYHVAFADFRTENTAVYVAHDGDDKHKKVKIQLFDYVIEITNAGNDLSVTVNGEKKTITEKPTYFNPDKNPDEITVFKYYKGVVVKSKNHALAVFSDGKNVKIKPSFLLRGHPSGLCGNFNGHSGDEFVNQYGVEFHTADKFVEQFKSTSC